MERYAELIAECSPLQTILQEDTPYTFDLDSLSELSMYLEEKQQAQLQCVYQESEDSSSAADKIATLKTTRFKGYKQIVDSFIHTGVNKMAVLTLSTKNNMAKFGCLWVLYS